MNEAVVSKGDNIWLNVSLINPANSPLEAEDRYIATSSSALVEIWL